MKNEMAEHFHRLFFIWAAVFVFLMPGSVMSVVSAGGSWSPDAGVVDPAIAPDGGEDDQFRYAVGLLNSGFTRQGIRQLERFLRQHPDSARVEAANYHLGLAHLQRENYEEAFDYLGSFAASASHKDEVKIARRLQLECAIAVGERNIREARPLFEELASAVGGDFAAECRLTLADLLFSRRRFHEALDAYLNFIDYHPVHEDVAEAWFYVAACHYELALRVARGRELLQSAKSALHDFLVNFPNHGRADEAEEMLAEINRREAERTVEVADYYLRVRRNPHAALDYLKWVEESYPDIAPAKRARMNIDAIKDAHGVPASGGYIKLPLDGVKAP